MREARAAAQLRHPNVASVFHLGTNRDAFFYAMEFVDGETVESFIKRQGPIDPVIALRITLQVARALAAAEKHHLVHRDIKPANLMLVREDDDFLVKVIDFGLAKSIKHEENDDLATLSMGGFVGTAHFASPEQLEEKEIDVRSDIYSLGVTLWYMLVGQAPFGGSLAQVMSQHLHKPPPLEKLQHFPASSARARGQNDREGSGEAPANAGRAARRIGEMSGRNPGRAAERRAGFPDHGRGHAAAVAAGADAGRCSGKSSRAIIWAVAAIVLVAARPVRLLDNAPGGENRRAPAATPTPAPSVAVTRPRSSPRKRRRHASAGHSRAHRVAKPKSRALPRHRSRRRRNTRAPGLAARRHGLRAVAKKFSAERSWPGAARVVAEQIAVGKGRLARRRFRRAARAVDRGGEARRGQRDGNAGRFPAQTGSESLLRLALRGRGRGTAPTPWRKSVCATRTAPACERDLVKAAQWFSRRSRRATLSAGTLLAECYLYGKGVNKNESKAIGLLQDAAAAQRPAGDGSARDLLSQGNRRGADRRRDAFRLIPLRRDLIYPDSVGNLGVALPNE